MDLIRAAILIMAVAPALLALLSLGGAFSERLDVLTHFTPAFGVAGLSAVALACGAESPDRIAIASGLLAALVAGVLMAPEWAARLARRRNDTEGPTLKLIQFNVWYLNQDPDRTARGSSRSDPT
jgi:endonuclease/exonuclease/phosphatase (EEP) superfamily protein YafD